MYKKLGKMESNKTRGQKYKLSDHNTRKSEINKELKDVQNNDLEVTVFRMELTYSEIGNILEIKAISHHLLDTFNYQVFL